MLVYSHVCIIMHTDTDYELHYQLREGQGWSAAAGEI